MNIQSRRWKKLYNFIPIFLSWIPEIPEETVSINLLWIGLSGSGAHWPKKIKLKTLTVQETIGQWLHLNPIESNCLFFLTPLPVTLKKNQDSIKLKATTFLFCLITKKSITVFTLAPWEDLKITKCSLLGVEEQAKSETKVVHIILSASYMIT